MSKIVLSMCDVRIFLTLTFVLKYFKGLIVIDGDGSQRIFHPHHKNKQLYILMPLLEMFIK
jgi:hypothetical protein